MNKWLSFLLIFGLVLACSDPAAAQYRSNGKKKSKPKPKTEKSAEETTEETLDVDDMLEDKKAFVDNLWYGANAGLQFGGNGNFSAFYLGLYPMVGYKIKDYWSVGPRIGAGYNLLQGTTTQNTVVRTSAIDLEGGLFTRLRILQLVYIHLEQNIVSKQAILGDDFGRIALDPETQKVVKSRSAKANTLLGVGFNNGYGDLGYDFGIYYNFSAPVVVDELPIILRVGLTYNF
jgi:hypothetical protein